MNIESLVRITLWLSVPFNFFAAGLLAFPTSALGQYIGLPPVVDPLYTSLCALLIGLFGLAYGWLAMQPKLNQPLLVLGAIGKLSVFALLLALWMSGSASGRMVIMASGDLAFASIWLAWWYSIGFSLD